METGTGSFWGWVVPPNKAREKSAPKNHTLAVRIFGGVWWEMFPVQWGRGDYRLVLSRRLLGFAAAVLLTKRRQRCPAQLCDGTYPLS